MVQRSHLLCLLEQPIVGHGYWPAEGERWGLGNEAWGQHPAPSSSSLKAPPSACPSSSLLTPCPCRQALQQARGTHQGVLVRATARCGPPGCPRVGPAARMGGPALGAALDVRQHQMAVPPPPPPLAVRAACVRAGALCCCQPYVKPGVSSARCIATPLQAHFRRALTAAADAPAAPTTRGNRSSTRGSNHGQGDQQRGRRQHRT